MAHTSENKQPVAGQQLAGPVQINPYRNKSPNPKPGSLPIRGGRQSQPPISLMGALNEMFGEIRPDFNLEILTFIEGLAMYNGDLSYAVNNVQQLGNTPYELSFGDDVPEAMAKEMAKVAKDGFENIYQGGVSSLLNDIFAQVAITGALSHEIVPNGNLDDIYQIIQVRTGTIRFIYDPIQQKSLPYQRLSAGLLDWNIAISGNLLQLNPETYKYYAITRFGEKPYAIPPFAAALESIIIEREMVKSLKSVIRKLGLFGFLSILLQPPKRNLERGETDLEYAQRCAQYLEQVRPEAEKGFASGLSLGFKNVHEFKMENTTMNVQGAMDLFKLITEFKMAGLKQDPLMLGRNFNVAETMAKVILAKLVTQIGNYQKVAASFLCDVYRLRLNLKGYTQTQNMQVEFEPAMVSDKLKEEQGFQFRIQNADLLYQSGVIDQTQKAHYLGYEEPAEDEPLPPAVPPLPNGVPVPNPSVGGKGGKKPGATKKPAQESKSFYLNKDQVGEIIMLPQNGENCHIIDLVLSDGRILPDVQVYNYSRAVAGETISAADVIEIIPNDPAALELELSRGCQVFDYAGCGHLHQSFDLSHFAKDEKIIKYLESYATATRKVYTAAVKKVIGKIAEELNKFSEGASLQMVQDRVLAILYKSWPQDFSQPQKAVINKWVDTAYRYYRGDDSVLGDLKDIPKPTFGMRDVRTMEYFKSSDKLYLGKFITDDDTKKKITEFIKDQYLDKGLPIGGNTGVISAFKDKFGDVMNGEDWKIQRVLSTTVNKLRNYAAVSYMDQAGVERFIIQGVQDRLQCPYCAALQGKSFTLKTSLSKLDTVVSSSPEYVSSVAPFITSVFKGKAGLEELEGMDAEQIQASGVDLPPFHCNCRDRIVADI